MDVDATGQGQNRPGDIGATRSAQVLQRRGDVGGLPETPKRHPGGGAPGLILIVAAGGVALIGLMIFTRSESRKPTGDTAVEMLEALAEPAALVWSDGRVLAFNAAWAEADGASNSLPRRGGKAAQALYTAFAQARAGEQGRALIPLGNRDVEALIGHAGPGRFLVRAAPETLLAEASGREVVAAAGDVTHLRPVDE